MKNTFICSVNKYVYFLGKTVRAGKTHDFTLFKQAFTPGQAWFLNHKLWIDSAYTGIRGLFTGLEIHVPFKKPRKTKTNPDPQLSNAQKEYNTWVSKNRIVVENAICGTKRYAILTNKFRNKSIEFSDQIIELCAGLWNFKVSKRMQKYATC